MSCNVAFIGLGVMGYPMAGYISKGGHNVTVYNRTGSKADKWLKDFKGKKADTPKDAAKDASNKSTLVTVETENAWEYKGQKFSSSLVRITHIL